MVLAKLFRLGRQFDDFHPALEAGMASTRIANRRSIMSKEKFEPGLETGDAGESPHRGIGWDAAGRQEEDGADRDAMRERIAVRAYYNAERRGFQGDGQVDDWLGAEREEMASRSGAVGMKREASLSGDGDAREESGQPQPRAGGGEHVEPDRVTDWAERLDVPAHRLREAIQRVGSLVEDIKQDLRDSAPAGAGAPRAPEDDSARPLATKRARAIRKGKSGI
jgi:hypothetical protein